MLLSREVVGWENVLELWDFLFDMSSISQGMTCNQLENRPHLGLMELLECAAASMLLLAREPLLQLTPSTPNGTHRWHDPSDKIDLLVNYQPIHELSLLKDHILFMAYQLHVMRKHEGSNPYSPKDFFFVQSPQRPRPRMSTTSTTEQNTELFTSQSSNRNKKWILKTQQGKNSVVDDRCEESTSKEIELISNDFLNDTSPIRLLQQNSSRLLKSAWNEASRRMMSKLDSMSHVRSPKRVIVHDSNENNL